MPWADIVQYAQLAGLVLAAIGLWYTGRQLRVSQKIAAGDFLLRFDEMLANYHNSVHERLRPGGDWSFGKGGPATQAEWIAVERYMGMFERVKILVDSGILDVDMVDRVYGYRIRNIVANHTIRAAKLESDLADDWHEFIALWHAVDASRQKRRARRGQ